MRRHARRARRCTACASTAQRYDIGNKLDFLKTNIEFGLARDDIGPDLAAYLREIVAGME